MGDSKRSVKNKARVEGSICASYLHRETTNFCSYYFKNEFAPRSSRNEMDLDQCPRHHLALSVFCLPGRPSGKESIHWLTEEELNAAHVHVLINCTEVQPFIEEFLSSEEVSEEQSSAHINAHFPMWFRQRVYDLPPTPTNQHLRNLSDGPRRCVKEWHTYFVNGYKFHTNEWTQGRETINSGVCMKGVTGGGENDFYGVVQHIYELTYPYLDYNQKVVVFYCNWFDPSSRGTKVNQKSNTVDIKMTGRYRLYDPFVIAQNVRQVYYVPYPSTRNDRRGWCVAIKTKPRGRIETNDDTLEDVPFQMDEMSNVNEVIQVEPITRLCDEPNTGEEVDDDEDAPSDAADHIGPSRIHSSDDDDFENEWDSN